MLSRGSGRATSRAAAESIVGHITDLQQRVLDALRAAGPTGLTDEELTETLALRPGSSTARTRRAELTEAGLVKDSGITRELQSKRLGTVWVLA
jgi:hypothetical protein